MGARDSSATRPRRLRCSTGAAILCFYGTLSAQSVILDVEDQEQKDIQTDVSWIPFGFFNQTFGTAVGVGAVVSHSTAPESSLLGAVTAGSTGSFNVALGGSQFRFPGTDRLYMYPLVVAARYMDQHIHVGRENPGFEGERAGAHESDPDNVFNATLWDTRLELEFRYLLPVGDGRGDRRINTYVVREGRLLRGATGGHSWNPMESGRTFLIFTPGYRRQTADNQDGITPFETLNFELGLRWDNRDFPDNPSTGGYAGLSYQRDVLDTPPLGGWSSWFLEGGMVVDLGRNRVAGQQVLAMDVWTAYSPSWETDAEENVTRRPPPFEGPRLGGFYRLRGYESDRFQDKAAVAYTAEYRITPRWQPLDDVNLLRWAKPRYWQWVLFAEAGRVAPQWDPAALHEDMKTSGGISLRGMFHQAVARLDLAVSEEGTRVVAMYGHPF